MLWFPQASWTMESTSTLIWLRPLAPPTRRSVPLARTVPAGPGVSQPGRPRGPLWGPPKGTTRLVTCIRGRCCGFVTHHLWQAVLPQTGEGQRAGWARPAGPSPRFPDPEVERPGAHPNRLWRDVGRGAG